MLSPPPASNKTGRRISVQRAGRSSFGGGEIPPLVPSPTSAGETGAPIVDPTPFDPFAPVAPKTSAPAASAFDNPFDFLSGVTSPPLSTHGPRSALQSPTPDTVRAAPVFDNNFDFLGSTAPLPASAARAPRSTDGLSADFDAKVSLGSAGPAAAYDPWAAQPAKPSPTPVATPTMSADFLDFFSGASAAPAVKQSAPASAGRAAAAPASSSDDDDDDDDDEEDDEEEAQPGRAAGAPETAVVDDDDLFADYNRMNQLRRDSASKGRLSGEVGTHSRSASMSAGSRRASGAGDRRSSQDGGARAGTDDAASRRDSESKAAASSASGKEPQPLDVNVLAYMKKGTPFLKYGSRGYPHFRLFMLSPHNTKLMWFSKAKKLKDTQVDIESINEVRIGQTTPNFAKHPAPELVKSSFSVFYDNRRKSLDLVAKDPNEFRIWVDGLRALVAKARETDITRLTELVITVPIIKARRSAMEIIDAKSGKTADQVLPGLSADEERKPTSSGNKVLYREVADNFAKMKDKLSRYRISLREPLFRMHAIFPNMLNIVKKVEEACVRVKERFDCGRPGHN